MLHEIFLSFHAIILEMEDFQTKQCYVNNIRFKPLLRQLFIDYLKRGLNLMFLSLKRRAIFK
jgi:hypothetical protein